MRLPRLADEEDLVTQTQIATGQVSVTTAVTAIVPAREARRVVLIKNLAASPTLYIGSGRVTTSTGFEVLAGSSIEISANAAIFGVTVSGTATVHYVEEWD